MYSRKILFAAFTFIAFLMLPLSAVAEDAACGSGETVWIRISAGPPGRVEKLVVHPTDPEVLVAATRRAVYMSFDGAATWTLVFRTGSTDVRGVALGKKELLVADAGGVYSGPLQGPLRREKAFSDSFQIRALIRLNGKTDRFMVAGGNRIWKRTAGTWKSCIAVFEEKIRSIAPGPFNSRFLAVVGERNVHISADWGRTFEKIALSSRPLDAALGTGPGSTVVLAVLTRDGIETARKEKSPFSIEKRIRPGAVVVRLEPASGGRRSWLLWGESAWMTADLNSGIKGTAVGLIGRPSAGAFVPAAERLEQKPAAWIATENGIFKSFWIRIRSTGDKVHWSEDEIDFSLVPEFEHVSFPFSFKRIRWSEYLPRFRLSLDVRISETIDFWDQRMRRANVRVWAALVWPLGRRSMSGSSLQLYARDRQRRIRRKMEYRRALMRALRQLNFVKEKGCNLNLFQRATLELQIEEIRTLLGSEVIHNPRRTGRGY